jgi:integrase
MHRQADIIGLKNNYRPAGGEGQAMITLRKRGKTFHLDLLISGEHVVRGSLGTKDRDNALRLSHRIDIALAEGPRSPVWFELRPVLPSPTFTRLANYAGVEGKLVLTWKESRSLFESHQDLQVGLDRLDPKTVDNYRNTLNAFELFLDGEHITMLQDIDESVIDRFQPWRLERINKRRSNGSSALELDLVHLHHFFAVAIRKGCFGDNNPVCVNVRRRDPSSGHQPFNADELRDLKNHADNDIFMFLLLRWTGFRRSDATILRWDEVQFDRREIEHVCKKTHRTTRAKVIIPISEELLNVLEAEYQRRKPMPGEHVLIDPKTGEPFDKPQLASNERYNALTDRISALGKRAGVRNATPHRFRDTFAVDMLIRTDNVNTVAALLGDTVKTVTEYYLPFVRELRERARLMMDHGKGIEQFETPASQKKAEAA